MARSASGGRGALLAERVLAIDPEPVDRGLLRPHDTVAYPDEQCDRGRENRYDRKEKSLHPCLPIPRC